jgi:transposase
VGYAEVIPAKPERTITSGLPTIQNLSAHSGSLSEPQTAFGLCERELRSHESTERSFHRVNEGLKPLLQLCRETVVRLQKTESALVRSLERDSSLTDRVERLMTIPAVGPITALTWALEVGDVQRFSSIKKASSYCGLCGAEKSSGNTVQRTPLSKQRFFFSLT